MKRKFIIFIIALIGAFSCESGFESNKDNIQITTEFLVHEWMVDSLYGSNDFIQDWVYFTPQGEFWRCSHRSKSLIIDSAFVFKNDSIFNNNQFAYFISALDSNNITLKSNENKIFHLRRWNEFEKKDIERFIENNPTKKNLNGNWVLHDSELTPVKIPSFCNTLQLKTRFKFNTDGMLEVYPKDSTTVCNSYDYKIFENYISLREYDMIMSLEIIEVSNEKLVLKSHYVPNELLWKEEIVNFKKNGYNMYFSKNEYIE